jgi:predicted PurR-regulated permease PerM
MRLEGVAVEGAFTAPDSNIGLLRIAHRFDVLRRDGLEVQEATRHRRHVLDRGSGVIVVEVRQDALTDEEVELLPRPPTRDVAQLVAVARAGVLTPIDGCVTNVGLVCFEVPPPKPCARTYIEDARHVTAEPANHPKNPPCELGHLVGSVHAGALSLVVPLEVSRVEGLHAVPVCTTMISMEPAASPSPFLRRAAIVTGITLALVLAYLLRGVLVPLFFAFLLAYALDPFVDRLERWRVPRTVGVLLVMSALFGLVAAFVSFAVPYFADEFRAASTDLQFDQLRARVEPFLLQTFKFKLPHTWSDVAEEIAQGGTLSTALFGTLGYVAIALSALIVPVFALYLLIDFDRIVRYTGKLVPRRWMRTTTSVAIQIHRTLGGYVRGQLTTCFVLGALYATGLRIVDIRLAVPIGVLTGMLAFVPYVGFGLGLCLALAMSLLEHHGYGPVVGVLLVMGSVQILDGTLITPRIVGKSVGLAPLEVLLTMMAAGSLLGFFGVLLAVPLGAVVKILLQRIVKLYLSSEFYSRSEPITDPKVVELERKRSVRE